VTTIVNSAGVSPLVPFEEETLAGFRHVLAVNLEGSFLGCRHGVEALKAGKGGAIINLGSTLGVKANPAFAAYSASKGGIRMLTRTAALHCAEQGYDIRVNMLLPGAVETEMFDGIIAPGLAKGARREDLVAAFAARHPMKRLGRPQEIAAAIAFLASDQASFITGAELPVDGGYLA
jgi:NAD(P)-dependent dehydrogenase (short-subunit alcohol dehydrogenase family)